MTAKKEQGEELKVFNVNRTAPKAEETTIAPEKLARMAKAANETTKEYEKHKHIERMTIYTYVLAAIIAGMVLAAIIVIV